MMKIKLIKPWYILLVLIPFSACRSGGKKIFPPNDTELQQFLVHPNRHGSGLDSLLTRASEDTAAYRRTVRLLDAALTDPNSPVRNEELGIQLLEHRFKYPQTTEAEKMAIASRLELMRKNRPGMIATDFSFQLGDSSYKKLSAIKNPHTILFFYNPECPACKEMKEALLGSYLIRRRAQVLAIYTDRDPALWRKHLPETPEGWINGRDTAEYLYKNRIYDLKAIPVLYLLDSNRKVVVKDAASISVIEAKLY